LIDFLGRIIVDILGISLKPYLGDKTYNVIKKVFAIIGLVFFIIIYGYMIMLYILMKLGI